VATVFLKDIGTYATLKEAIHESYKIIQNALATTGLAWMALDTTVWIEDVNKTSYYNFYEWRDLACDKGWLVDGKWIDN
jgi:hypothetical protein